MTAKYGRMLQVQVRGAVFRGTTVNLFKTAENHAHTWCTGLTICAPGSKKSGHWVQGAS